MFVDNTLSIVYFVLMDRKAAEKYAIKIYKKS